ncbi:MAG TPA: bifunctional 23S rRNA (guanine(2069)-N(7))-methyltransferase RlmK/23S rRNA (guanine(2445)-N(2))-methyltransferase RlmL [Steroidobacteraceae bacterium]|jgi:23S rRNA (guanine2445-N2)-methyltransferase / 23S rRNA (guanine2069-N7)-methyltransferase|nr:bifunctional 23S rRNA (guanine(2069)-N(7))-methyltransferase RlmK/23S rRNA (guanine(2445)-N(2))-methyltransferase RlmL [Steroidobacteraceae bacterium]
MSQPAVPTSYRFVASSPRGFGDLLARELRALGAQEVRERALGVEFAGPLEVAYRACLESRVAARVFLVVADFDAPSDAQFYAALRAIDWRPHVDPARTLACDFTGKHPELTHTRFGALRLKDAICDQLRDATGARPDISTERPAVRVHAHANGPKVTVSLDLSGEGLHRRGYRTQAGEAPLRENLAAGILVRAGWEEKSRNAAEFLDPMCGSGTLVIEAAMIAADMAPNARRHYFGFLGWPGHDRATWERVKGAALARERRPAMIIRGVDVDDRVLDAARDNAARAGLEGVVTFARGDLTAAAPASEGKGLLATNPPYGVRLEDNDSARALMKQLGGVLRARFGGWDAAILAGSPDAGLELGLRAERVHTVWNGALECRLLRVQVSAQAEKQLIHSGRTARIDESLAESPGSKMFGNRVSKNLKQLEKWAQRERVSCYRVYDADMPEYSFAIDRYAEADSDRVWLYVQEYTAPKTINPDAVQRRRNEALAALPGVTGIPADRIHLRQRRKTSRGEQYEKLGEKAEFRLVEEGGLRFWVNFTDYLDTGLFLDHRITRQRLRDAATHKRFLNLFAYTGSATVYAAAGRARATTTVDMSATYLDWAQRNLAVNGLSGSQHEFLQEDCIAWLKGAVVERRTYDLIFLDPPTFSNSKRMEDIHDVQRDHRALIDRCMALLAPGGKLVFSTNAQKFKLDAEVGALYKVTDISRATLPKDFERNARIHQCFELESKP